MSDIVYCPPNVDCPCYAKLVSENATFRADLQKLNERNAEYIGTIDRLRRRVAETDVEIERLRAALREYLGADDHLAKVMPQRVGEGVIAAAIERVRAAKREARAALAEEKQ